MLGCLEATKTVKLFMKVHKQTNTALNVKKMFSAHSLRIKASMHGFAHLEQGMHMESNLSMRMCCIFLGLSVQVNK